MISLIGFIRLSYRVGRREFGVESLKNIGIPLFNVLRYEILHFIAQNGKIRLLRFKMINGKEERLEKKVWNIIY
jgi:hypothetical protein